MRTLLEHFRLALAAFSAAPLRSALTLLGVVIGAAMVVASMGLLEGLREKVNRDFSQLGAQTFRIDKWPQMMISTKRTNWRQLDERPSLTLADRLALQEQVPEGTIVAASARRFGFRVSTAAASTDPRVMVEGTTADYLSTSGAEIALGRYFTEDEALNGARVVVIGPDLVDQLFVSANPLGQPVRVRGRLYTVIGVLARRGKILGMVNMDNNVMVPLSAFLDQFGRRRSITLNVQAANAEVLQSTQDIAVRVLRQRRGVAPNADNNFELATNESQTRSFNQLSLIVSLATFGICALSLVVSGIGILNIMLVSVTERTREIGIRKALGARRADIVGQFAIEAILLSTLGGALGCLLGGAVSLSANVFLGIPTQVPFWAIALALSVSCATGLFFGIYPALSAARLDPVEAMRQES